MTVYGFLRQPKWAALTVLLLFVVPVSALAARWQYNRWEERRALNAAVSTNTAAPVVPLSSLVQPGAPLPTGTEWRVVTATGTYDPAGQVLVRKQPLGGENGFIVVTPLVTPDGVLPVQRGWIGAAGDARTAPTVPPPPPGQVSVTGRVRDSVSRDEAQPADLPAGQVNWIDPVQLAGGRPGYHASLELTSSTPAQAPGLTLLPEPELTEGPHLSYVGQWTLIGLASIVIWVVVVRREAAHRREAVPEAVDHPA